MKVTPSTAWHRLDRPFTRSLLSWQVGQIKTSRIAEMCKTVSERKAAPTAIEVFSWTMRFEELKEGLERLRLMGRGGRGTMC